MRYAKKFLIQFSVVFFYTFMFLYGASEILTNINFKDLLDVLRFVIGVLLVIISLLILTLYIIDIIKGEDV